MSMRPIATDVTVIMSGGLSLCLCCAKTTDPGEMPFGV